MDKSERSGFVKSVLTVATGAGAGQLVAVLVGPILTRLFTKADFGLFGLYALLVSFIAPLAVARFDVALIVPKTKEDANSLLKLCFYVLGASVVVVGVASVVWRHEISSLIGAPEFASLALLLPIGVLAAGCFQVANIWAIRQQGFRAIASGKAVQGVTQAAAQSGAGVLQLASFGLALGDVAGRLLGSLTILGRHSRTILYALKNSTTESVKASAKRYRAFATVTLPATAMQLVTNVAPPIVLGVIVGQVELGLLFVAIRYLNAPMSLLAQTIAQVYLGKASEMARTGDPALYGMFIAVRNRLALVGLLPFAAVALAGPAIFGFVFGPDFADSGAYARIMSLAWYCQFVASPLHSLNMLEKQRLFAKIQFVGLVISCGWMYWAWSQSVPMQSALIAFSSTVAVVYVLILIASQREVKRVSAAATGHTDQPAS
ncbi:MAG: oligosaccharide flippase family protein [Armatimonadetes bacterium]|nr:oligosaccharide flippase family protein [Armatimonadota bacterium]